MSDKESNVDYVEGNGPLTTNGAEAGAAYPVTKKQKLSRHCKRFWWVHLLIFICITVLVVCLIIFVAVPKIAQSRINGAKLSIQGISVTQTQSTNFTMSINSTVEADDSIHAVIAAFEGDMYLEDWAPQTPFARISFPQTTSASKTAVNVTQFTQILDMNAFTVFNEWLLVNATVNVTVAGDTTVQVSGISKKYPVSFKKTVSMPGLSNFNGTTVPNSTVSLTADALGDNFHGTVIIPNRSLVTFEIGNTSFINYLLGANVGTSYIDNMILYPGNNTFSMRGNISQSPVLTDIQTRPYCEDGILPFQLQGLNVSNHGQYLSYYAESLGSTNESVSIDVGADLEALGLTITCSNTTTKRGMEADLVLSS
ncbi:hypothetical protein M406DRAFT_321256 [Cryphonectria parasitica EP155]|uniref:Uncharacterized protein n=1 Tax=Cryphonectria parasitica (strain ATCC 38755 / EP155) TaxID=660469 RepID=A0A9P5CS80_CRYP1|nr:uncharacterized protein M406DRAFT_321256 [Cryphonectria parasitica EP155]KAF3769339.1 hypothetical protein M406DRAFT_321256 [Cryphonectria parasitica EP155]